MILAYKKTLGKFTKVLGFEKTPPPLGKIPKKSRFFFWGVPLRRQDQSGLFACSFPGKNNDLVGVPTLPGGVPLYVSRKEALEKDHLSEQVRSSSNVKSNNE